MQPYLDAFPLPNGTDNTATGIADFSTSFSNPATLNAYSLRIDHRLNDKLTLFGRYNYSPSEIDARGGTVNALSVVTSSRIATQTATIGATLAVSAEISNDFRFNFSRTNASSGALLDDFGGAVPLESLPLPSPFTIQNANFGLYISSLTSGEQLFVGPLGDNIQRQINLVDNLSLQRGSHNLKFGVDFRRLSPVMAPALYEQGVDFSDVPSAAMGNGFGYIESQINATLLFHNLGVFAQDSWRVNPRLTLTYGLRWDIDFPPSSLNGPSIPAVTGYSLTNFAQLAIAPAGTPPFKTTYGNVAPRLGLAYQLTQNQDRQTVLRGGFGVFYDLVSAETGTLVSFGNAPFVGISYPSGTFPYSPSEITPPAIPPASISAVYAFNPSLKLPYTLEWNIALEQGLGKQQTISVSYVGASGKRLLQTSDVISPPTNPNVGSVNGAEFIDNTAISDYNALQVQFQRRLSRGFQALASYTWSHSIDTASASSLAIGGNEGLAGSNANVNRGPSDFDIRNTFSAGLTYDVLAPRNNTLTNAILQGWSLQSSILARSAPPVDVSDTNFSFFNGGIRAEVRPDLVPGQPLYLYGAQCLQALPAGFGQVCPGGMGFNPNAFTNPPIDPTTGNPLRQGDVPRNLLRGFGVTQWDFGVHRDFPLHESIKLQFRAEMFNILNHPNFGQPSGAFGFGGFGLSTNTLAQYLNGGSTGVSNAGGGAFSPLYQIGGPRSIQFALKLLF